MSTFNGVVPEFQHVRIDYFRNVSEAPGAPLAYFLSHVHTDHTVGLENYKSPAFIYCSSATREIILRLEKFTNRRNFEHGILEAKQMHFKHLATRLRPIPLNTPTNIQLTAQIAIRVTLFDANHCPGSVMFLIEGGGKSILYTGDIRAEPWWRDTLLRNPIMIPYASGLRTLNTIYLDTTHGNKAEKNRDFPSKAFGMEHLLLKVAQYPQDTVFHIHTWTLGYEEVLASLAAAYSSKIHVDQYKADLYMALTKCSDSVPHAEATFMSGYFLASDPAKEHSKWVEGFLTTKTTQFHACSPPCIFVREAAKLVRITPMINRGLHEIGAQPPVKEQNAKSSDSTETVFDGIAFPFARHSSYTELCELVAALRPEEVYPCVTEGEFCSETSMAFLFGRFCEGSQFRYDDEEMAKIALEEIDHPEMETQNTECGQYETQRTIEDERDYTQRYGHGTDTQSSDPEYGPPKRIRTRANSEEIIRLAPITPPAKRHRNHDPTLDVSDRFGSIPTSPLTRRVKNSVTVKCNEVSEPLSDPDSQITLSDGNFDSQQSESVGQPSSKDRIWYRKQAYKAAKDPDQWAVLPSLSLSGEFEEELELG